MVIRDILSHTSGLPFASAAEQPTLDLLPLRVGALTYAMTPLQSEPGTKYRYSNAGINTAGRIIEVVGGMPYEEFLDARLLRPLGMKDTTFWPSDEQLGRLAKSYKPNREGNGLDETTVTQLRYPLNDRKRQPMPAGGLFSTAHDLARFCQMVLGGGVFNGKRYLSAESVRQMTSVQTGDLIALSGVGSANVYNPGVAGDTILTHGPALNDGQSSSFFTGPPNQKLNLSAEFTPTPPVAPVAAPPAPVATPLPVTKKCKKPKKSAASSAPVGLHRPKISAARAMKPLPPIMFLVNV
jgi:CubicO group peptidase (beta-lactamase class C family)